MRLKKHPLFSLLFSYSTTTTLMCVPLPLLLLKRQRGYYVLLFRKKSTRSLPHGRKRVKGNILNQTLVHLAACSPGIQSIVFIHQYSLVRPSVCPSGGFLFSSAHLSDTVLKNPLEFEQRQMGENWGFIWYSTSILLFFCEMRE